MPGPEDLDPAQRSALRDETRRAIFELVARTPGLNISQVARRFDVDRSKAEHHLERLEAYELVVQLPGERGNEVLCFHPDHEHLWEDDRTRVLYGQAPVRHVALFVHAHPGAATKRIADALESAPRTIRDHLAMLRGHELVEMHRFQRRVEYHPTDVLEAWAEAVGDCYRRPWTVE